MVNEL